MFKAKNITLILYIIGCLIYIFLKQKSYLFLEQISKFVVVLLLVVHYLTLKTKINYLFIVILLFEMIGDAIMMYYNVDNFMLGLPFFFVVNVLLILMMVERVKIIKLRYVLLFFIVSLSVILPIVYFVFAEVGFMLFIVVSFGVVVSMLMAGVFYYFKINPQKKSAKWLLLSVLLLVLLYVFGGYTRLVSQEPMMRLMTSLTYLGHLYSFVRFIEIDEQENNRVKQV